MHRVIKTKKESGYTWIDILAPTQEEVEALAAEYELHPAAVQDVLQPEHLPKIEQFDDMEFIICRYYDADADKDADNIHKMSRKLAIFFRKDLVLTIHRQTSPNYEALIEKYKSNNTLKAYELTCKIIKGVLATYEEPSNKLDQEIDFYENRFFLKKRIPDLLKNLYLIKRKINIIRKISNLTQEVIDHMAIIAPQHKAKPTFQDLKDYYVKVDTMIESNHDDINGLLNIYISISSQRTNEVMRTLTVFTAFFLPITFIVGVYGMNFEFMPELKHPLGYPAVILSMVVVTLFIYIWFRRKGWM
jgi:magnesium transporter